MTATHLIYQALRDLGCLRSGQTTSPDVLNDCLGSLNQMLDSWQLDKLLLYADRADLYTLTAGKAEYGIGPGGEFAAARPVSINDANILYPAGQTTLRQPVTIIGDDEWARIRLRDLRTIPTRLYFERSFFAGGQAAIHLWPVPDQAYQLELYTPQALGSFVDLATDYKFPPAYERAIRRNLAVEIAPQMVISSKLNNLERPQENLLPLIKQQADEALRAIRSYNAPAPVLGNDGSMMSGRRNTFSTRAGE